MAKFLRNKTYNSARGQIIVEAVIAIFIMVTAVLVFLGLLSRSTGLNRFINDRYTAVYLAVEGIEVVKNIVDANYLQGQSWNRGVDDGDYEIIYNSVNLEDSQDSFLRFTSDGFYDYDLAGNQTPFKRTVVIKAVSANEIKVNSIVDWKSRGVDYTIDLEDHFFDWR